ncbi:MAG: hypothetical protein ACR2HR_03205 [Euzebya sp.]
MGEVVLEGIRASIEPCSLALILPGIGAVVLGGRRGYLVAAGFWLTAAVLAWAQASLVLQVGSDGGVIGVVLAVVAVVGAVLVWLAGRRGMDGSAVLVGALAGGVLLGAATGLLWRPCVGPELGTILTQAPRDPASQLVPLAVYLVGVLLVTAVLAALPFLHPVFGRVMTWLPVRLLALVPILGLAVILVTSRYAEVIGALVQASSI